jgi:hypothetical protein
MNFKTTYVLFGVLISLLAIFGLTVWLKKPPVDETYLLPSFHDAANPLRITDVDTVEIQDGGDRFVFARDRRGWHLEGPGVRLLGYEVNLLVKEIADARQDEETDVTNDPSRWGLENPRKVVVLRKGNNREWKLRLGKESPEKDGVVYVASSDRPGEVLAVKRSQLAGVVNFKFDKFWARKLLTADPLITRELTIARGTAKDNPGFTLRKQAGTDSYTFERPPYGPAELEKGIFAMAGARPKDSPGVHGLLEIINNLQAKDLNYDKPDLAKHRLEEDSPTALRIVVENARRPEAGGEEAPRAVRHTLLIDILDLEKGKLTRKTYYARLLPEQVVYQLPPGNLDTIATLWKERGERLRSLKLMPDAPAADAIEIRNEHGRIELRRVAGNFWKLRSSATGVQQAEYEEVHALLMALEKDHQVLAFPAGKDVALGLDRATTSISVWIGGLAADAAEEQDTEKKDPKKDKTEKNDVQAFPLLGKKVEGNPTLRLVFAQPRGDRVNARREADQQTTYVAVATPFFQTLQRPALAYLSRNLAGFTTQQVARVSITRSHEDYELTRQKDGRGWDLKGPAASARADGSQVQHLLMMLTQLKIQQWVKVNPDVAELKLFGLHRPELQVIVTARRTNGKAETWTFAFGKEGKYGSGQAGVYCRALLSEDGNDRVFFVAPELLKALREVELRDRHIFELDPARVRRLAIEGLTGMKNDDLRVRLELERDGEGGWKVMASPQGFKLDEAAVDRFLQQLTGQALVRFLQGGNRGEYKLRKEKCTLYIELGLRGQEKAAWLMIGRQDDRQPYYYARCSRLPGEVFLLPQGTFGGLLTKPPWLRHFESGIMK